MPRRFKAGRIKQTRSRKQTATFAKSVMGDGTHIETLPTDRLLAQERENDPVFHSQRKLGGTIDDSIPFPPTVFYWPGQYTLAATTGTTPTFTRATSATFEDFEGVIRTADSSEPRFVGARRVENVVQNSQNIEGAGWGKAAAGAGSVPVLVSGNTYTLDSGGSTSSDWSGFYQYLSVINGHSTVARFEVSASREINLWVWGGDTAAGVSQVTVGPTTQIISITHASITSGGFYWRVYGNQTGVNGLPVDVTMTKVQVEITDGQTNQNPSEYVSTGVGTGAEVLVNSDFEQGATGWTVIGEDATHIATFASGEMRYQSDTFSPSLIVRQADVLVVGREYIFEYEVTSHTVGTLKMLSPDNTMNSAIGKHTIQFTAIQALFSVARNTPEVDITFGSFSVKEVSHGANIDGVQYFNTLNANTVTAGVVTEATGSAITSATTQFGDLNGGAGDYFSTPDSVANSLRQSMVIDVDLVLDEDSGGYRTIMCKGYSAPSRGWFIDESVGGQLRFYISGDGTAQVGITGTNSIPRGQRFNLKAVYDAVTTGISLLVNDVEIASNTSTGITSLYDNAGLVSVGCNPSASYDSIDGKIYSATVTKGPTAEAYARFGGVVGSYIVTPDSAANSISGSMTIDIDMVMDDITATGVRTLIGKGFNAGSRNWFVDLNASTQVIRFYISGDGTAQVGISGASGKTKGDRFNLQAVYDAATTAISLLVDGVVVATNASTGISSLFDSSANVSVGGNATASTTSATATIYSAKLYNGIGASKVLVNNFYPQPYLQGDTNFTSVTGELWTLQGNAIATSPIDDGVKVDFNANDYVAGQTFESSGTNAELWTLQGNAKAFTPLSQAIDVDGSSDGWTSPDSAAASITGDIFLAGWGAPDDWTPSGDEWISGKHENTGAQKSYNLGIDTLGYIKLTASTNGSNEVVADSDTSTGFTNGTLHGFGASLDVSANLATFYTTRVSPFTPHNKVVWTQLGDPVAHGASSIFDSTALVTIGGLKNGVSAANWTGRIMRAYAIASTDPTVQPAWDFDARALTPGVTTGTMPTGEVWTAVGNGTIEAQIPAPWDASGPFGYLAEGARTNLQSYSAEFDNVAYTEVETTTVPNSAVAPDGTLTAYLFDVSIATAGHRHFNISTYSTSTGTDYTASFYLKDSGVQYMQIRHYWDVNDWTAVVYDLVNGTVTDTASGSGTSTLSDSGIEAVGDGWYRCWAAAQDSSLVALYSILDSSNSATPSRTAGGGVISYTGVAGEDAYFWGKQVEAGAFPSSYIATAAAAVTRNADLLTAPAAGNADTFPMTVSVDYVPSQITAGARVVDINDGSTTDRVVLSGQTTGKMRGFTSSASATVALIDSTADLVVGVPESFALAVALNDVEMYSNGATTGTPDTSAALPVDAMTVINVGSDSAGGIQPYGNIRNVKIFDERLTDAEVADL